MRLPKHVAIIPDGNRRWAKDSGLDKSKGYTHGLNPGLEALRIAKAYGIEELTFYGFTVDNCKRPKEQVLAFTEACVEAVKLIQDDDANLLVVGNTCSNMFPKELLPYTRHRVSIGNHPIRVNFLVNYGWDWDLSGIYADLSKNHLPIEKRIHSHDISRIDLIVRWGNHTRLSGLLPVQSVYADFYTIPEMWPDFDPSQFEAALKWYSKQDVTLGG